MKILISVLALACCCSCIQKRYLHNAPAVLNPMAREKNEVYAAAYYHSNGGSNNAQTFELAKTSSKGLNLQGAWAFTEHLGVAGAYSYLHQHQFYEGLYSEPFDQSEVRYDRQEFTLAGNYIVNDSQKQHSMNLLFGSTIGTLKMRDAGTLGGADYTRRYDVKSRALFIQPCFNFFFPGTSSALGFSTKLGMQYYGDIRTDYTDTEMARLRLDQTGWSFMAEGGMKASVGFKSLPLYLDFQGNYIYYHSARIHVRRPNFSAGISYRFAGRKKD